MAFLDFANAHSNQQQSHTPNVDKLPDSVKAQAVDAARPSVRIMDAAANADAKRSTHSGHADGREALIRNQGDQGKEQSAMSPTDHNRSQTPTQARSQGRERGMER
jgi:hypothetical protein